MEAGGVLELFKAIILGVVQGLTEFLPISSSGHLVIASELLEFQQQGIVFDVFLHLGTLLAVVLVFRKELREMIKAPITIVFGKSDEESRKYLLWDVYVIIATLPAVLVGLFLRHHIESLFDNLTLVYSMLLVTALLMLLSPLLTERGIRLNRLRSLIMGCAQACAILPGLSRSGSTIFIGMALGMNREVVAKFSFIMSIPAILGATVLQCGELFRQPPGFDSMVNIGAGTVMAAVSGYFAIVLLLDIVRRNRLQYFGYYCLCVAFLGFWLQLLG